MVGLWTGPMKFKDYYTILGVDRDSSQDQIKKAYRKLARQYHPDVAKEAEAEERFKEISEAYQTLSDPEKRKAYDELGRHRPGEDFNPSPEWETRFWRGGGPHEVDLADLFEQMGFRSAARSRRAPVDFAIRGQDVEVATELSLEQAAHGSEVTFTLTVPSFRADGSVERLPRSGRIRVPSGVVDGERLFKAVEHDLYLELPIAPWEAALGAEIEVPTLEGPVTVNVKPGLRNGQKLRIAGKGLPRRGEGTGDLYGVLQIVMPAAIDERERELYRELSEASPFNPRTHLEGARTHG
jgi:curved DNA-binding protein